MGPNLKFFLVVSAILIAIDLYTWQGIRVLTQNWSDKSRTILKYSYFGFTIISFLFFLTWRMAWIKMPIPVLRIFSAIYFLVVMAKVLWVVFIFLDDVLRFFRWVWAKIAGMTGNANSSGEESGISRLKFLHYTGFGLGSLFMATGIYGITKGAHNYRVRRRNLGIKNLPAAFEGLRIVQISDVHSGSFWSRSAVKEGVDLLNKEKADMVFFTGDLVNDTADEMEPWKEVFSKITAPLGVYSILGNHDYGDYYQWHDKDPEQRGMPVADKSHMSPAQKVNFQKLIDTHAELGWKLLQDDHHIIEKNGSKLAIIGVENWSIKARFPRYGNLKKAYEGAEDADVKLLLSHDPSHWKAEVLPHFPEIAATFSGHTHGMQFGVDTRYYRWSPVKMLYKEWMDLYTEGNQYLYVNRGFGYLGFPGRIGINPEISVFTLTKA